MPEPSVRGERYMPGLDGLRAIAVIVVVAYHVGFGGAPGGLLGVGVFFTLSGYLITDLLLSRWISGESGIVDFWRRRARRLLPGLFVMLMVVAAWVAFGHSSQLGAVRGQTFAATLYISNWWQIVQHVSYFSRFSAPSPLNHLWSLAVEEQFYLLWPWLLLLGVRFIPERSRVAGVRPRLAIVTVGLAVLSAIEMAALYHPSFDATRVYDGTDTRAFGLLFGAALAMVWPSRLLTRPIKTAARRTLDRAGFCGLAVILLLVWRTGQYSAFLYHGGLVLLSLATVLVIAAAAHPSTRLGRALAWEPLRWLGVRSYGIYLWHVPVIVLTSPPLSSGFDLPRAFLQVSASVGLAALSWRFIESPVRRGELGAAITHARLVGWRSVPVRTLYGSSVAAVCGCVALLAVLLVHGTPASDLALARGAAKSSSKTGTARSSSSVLASAVISGNPARSSCTSVVHIGDSTSDGLTSPDYLPNPRQRIEAQYARVGATKQTFEIQGGTSIVETIQGETDAYGVAKRIKQRGYHGCWVIALGTNDAADVAVGSGVSLTTRIKRMMSAIGGDPVMWVNVKSLVPSGPYSETDMTRWNAALVQACTAYPNMRIFDWASVVQGNWFIADGIHYTSLGYQHRAQLIANALARSFPSGGSSSGCLVSVPPPLAAPLSGSLSGPSNVVASSGAAGGSAA